MFDFSADVLPGMSTFVLILIVAGLLGVIVGVTYIKTCKPGIPSQSFALTLVILPIVVTVIIMLVGSNVARAFSLSGAFAIIRFRSAPGDAKDITYVLFCMAIGLACGMGFLLYALIIALVLCAATVILFFTRFGSSRSKKKILKILIPENYNFQNAFDDILKKYTTRYELRKISTTDLGSLYELSYNITMLNEANEKDFIDEIRCRNGNLTITLVLEPQAADFQF